MPSSGDVINSFIDWLESGPKEWVLSQAPVGEKYTSPQDAYMKALQYETNHQIRQVAPRMNLHFHRGRERKVVPTGIHIDGFLLQAPCRARGPEIRSI